MTTPGATGNKPAQRRRSLRPEEESARAMISHALGIPVEQHDDGSRPGMHDLDIVHDDVTRAAVEVTAAADAASIELWNLMNGAHRRWQVGGVTGRLDGVSRSAGARQPTSE